MVTTEETVAGVVLRKRAGAGAGAGARARAVLVLVVMVVLLHPLLLRKRRSRLIKCWI